MAVSKKGTFLPIIILFISFLFISCGSTVLGEEKTDKKGMKKQETVQTGKTGPLEELKRETIEKLPKGRDFLSIVPLVPGINYEKRLGGLSVYGASGAENRYYIDGIDTTALYTGESGMRVNVDFIEAIEIPTGGISAGFTGSTGGVVQVITRSGENMFHGALNLYYDGSTLNGKPRPTLRRMPMDDNMAEYVTYPEDKWSRIEPGFTLGGPILKDKVWFFTGFMPRFQTTTRNGDNWPVPGWTVWPEITPVSTIFHGETHISGSNEFKKKDTWYAGILKLTGQPVENLRFSINALLDYYEWKGELPPENGSGDPMKEYSEIGFNFPKFSLGGTVDYIVSPNLSLHVSADYYRSNEKELYGPDGARIFHVTSNADIPGIPPDLIAQGGWTNGPYMQIFYQITKNIQTRLTSSFDLSYSFDLFGRHYLKAGLQATRFNIDKNAGYPYDYYRFYWLRDYEHSDGTTIPTTYGYVEVRSPFGVVVEDVHSTGFAVFL